MAPETFSKSSGNEGTDLIDLAMEGLVDSVIILTARKLMNNTGELNINVKYTRVV